jgi:hypothetical protein
LDNDSTTGKKTPTVKFCLYNITVKRTGTPTQSWK